MLQNIKTSFNFMDKKMIRKIITTMIRPKLKYASVVCSPQKKEIRKLERIQRIATKLIPEISNITYKDRLREMDLPTLEQRRERRDMITLYKFVNKIDKIDKDDQLLPARSQGLRGHGKKLRKGNSLRDMKKYSFSQRSVDMWNKLKEVVEVRNVHQMEEKLDNYRYGDGTNKA